MLAPDLEFDLLRCFLAVIDNGGFTSAGKRLHLTQSAVSLKIRRLETLLGRRLFERTSRTLELTQDGELLAGYARRLLALGEEMVRRVTAPEVEGVLRLGVAEHFVPQRLPILLTQLRRAFPKVQLSVEVGMSSEILAGMEQGRLDLAITTAGEQPASGERPRAFEQIAILFEEPLVWVRGESMTPVAPGEIVPLALLPAPCFYRRAALEALERSARSWKIVYSSASLPSVQAAVQAGFALTAISRSSALPGMKILDGRESLGQLPTIRVAIYRAPSAGQLLVNSLSEFISETVQHWMFGASELPTFPDVYDRADATSVNRKIPAESSESVAQLAVAPRS